MKELKARGMRHDLSAQPGIHLSGAEGGHWFPPFIFVWCWPWLSPAVLDDPLVEQRENNRSLVFTQQPTDVSNRHVAVEEEMTDREGSFGFLIEG